MHSKKCPSWLLELLALRREQLRFSLRFSLFALAS